MQSSRRTAPFLAAASLLTNCAAVASRPISTPRSTRWSTGGGTRKSCVAPKKKISASAPPAPSVPLKGSVEVDDDTCIICLDNIVSAKLRPRGHSTTCKECTRVLITRSEPCPLCRKKITGFTLGKWQSTIGEHGLWPTSLKNLTQLASGEGINEYFQKFSLGTRCRI